jgi:hypothetical protein
MFVSDICKVFYGMYGEEDKYLQCILWGKLQEYCSLEEVDVYGRKY